MASEFHLLYPKNYKSEQECKMRDFQFLHTLQIDAMVILLKESFRGLPDLALQDYVSTDPEVLEYRLAVVEDLVANDELYDAFCRSITIIHNLNEIRHVLGGDNTVDSALSSVRTLEMYQEIVTLFSEALDNAELHSEGLMDFRNQLQAIVEGEEFQSLSEEISQMEMNFGSIKSITIGMNLDVNLCPMEAGIVSVNRKPFQSGTIMDKLLHKNMNDPYALMNSFFPLPKGLKSEELKMMNYAIRESLEKIFSKSLRDFKTIIHNYYSINTAVFVSLLNDIRFLTAGVKFVREMLELGIPMCRPVVARMEEKRCELTNVYNPMLAQKFTHETIVSNSFQLDENGRYYLLTGPNHGGKSIFAYSVGMAQALFQLGLFVPAEHAVMSPVSGIYTHFPVSDENNYGKGRLESECARLGEIMKQLRDTDMLLMDESFSSTSGLEGGYIASEVLTGIGIIGCCGIYVTHIHDLPQRIAEYNSHPQNRGKIDNLVALMENKKDGSRSYKIARTTPDGLSYAKDIAAKYGLSLEGILHGKESENDNMD